MKTFASILLTALLAALTVPAVAIAAGADGQHKSIRNGSAAGDRISYERPKHKRRMKQRAKRRRAVTPYGDFCTRCSKYGIGKRPVTPREALAAIEDYFRRKGLEVKSIKGRGRFLRAEIYKGELLVDKVLFDRRTGRIRSIY